MSNHDGVTAEVGSCDIEQQVTPGEVVIGAVIVGAHIEATFLPQVYIYERVEALAQQRQSAVRVYPDTLVGQRGLHDARVGHDTDKMLGAHQCVALWRIPVRRVVSPGRRRVKVSSSPHSGRGASAGLVEHAVHSRHIAITSETVVTLIFIDKFQAIFPCSSSFCRKSNTYTGLWKYSPVRGSCSLA